MKAKVIIVVGFLIAFAAGLVVALWMRQPAVAAVVPGAKHEERRPWLARELGLDAEKAKQLEKIWSEARRNAEREHDERRRSVRRERDEAILAMLKPEDREAYEKIQQDYMDKMTQLGRGRGRHMEEAVARTKEILTPEQRVKYEELLKRAEAERAARDKERAERGDRERRGPGGGTHRRGTGGPASTRPAE
jgi:Spy/CpxP family protein refolding chaperone